MAGSGATSAPNVSWCRQSVFFWCRVLYGVRKNIKIETPINHFKKSVLLQKGPQLHFGETKQNVAVICEDEHYVCSC